DLEASVISEGGIEQAQAMRKVDLLVDCEVLSLANSNRRGGPFAYAVEGEYDSALERRRIKGRGCMAQMMLAECQAIGPVDIALGGLELAGEKRFLKQFLAEPERQGHTKRCKPAGAIGEIGFQQALEFDERFVVEGHSVEVLSSDAARA